MGWPLLETPPSRRAFMRSAYSQLRKWMPQACNKSLQEQLHAHTLLPKSGLWRKSPLDRCKCTGTSKTSICDANSESSSSLLMLPEAGHAALAVQLCTNACQLIPDLKMPFALQLIGVSGRLGLNSQRAWLLGIKSLIGAPVWRFCESQEPNLAI